jgi:hypothetical protein
VKTAQSPIVPAPGPAPVHYRPRASVANLPPPPTGGAFLENLARERRARELINAPDPSRRFVLPPARVISPPAFIKNIKYLPIPLPETPRTSTQLSKPIPSIVTPSSVRPKVKKSGLSNNIEASRAEATKPVPVKRPTAEPKPRRASVPTDEESFAGPSRTPTRPRSLSRSGLVEEKPSKRSRDLFGEFSEEDASRSKEVTLHLLREASQNLHHVEIEPPPKTEPPVLHLSSEEDTSSSDSSSTSSFDSSSEGETSSSEDEAPPDKG